MAVTNAVVRLYQKPAYLDINAGRYAVLDDFIPPQVATSTLFAPGTSANRTGGAALVGTKLENRSWSFSVLVQGASESEVRKSIRDLQAFANRYGDASNPLYLQYGTNSDAPEPLWGQDWLYYEIVYAVVTIGQLYPVFQGRGSGTPVSVTLTIKPVAVGRPQRLGSAIGGVFEDYIGAADGRSRGLRVPESTTNKMTNPIFGHSTWNNGWTDGAGVDSYQNTDPQFALFGRSTAQVIRVAGTATFTQSINVGNTSTHTLSCYVKKPDGSAVTSSDVLLFYGSAVAAGSTTFLSVGDGWYRVYASVTGVNAATATGINPQAVGAALYVDGFQIEQLAYPTPLAHGDMLGCAWTGTAHASTTTRTAARVSVPIAADTFSVSEWTIRLAWKTDYARTHGNNMVLLDTTGNIIRFFFQASDDKFYLEDDTASISSAAQTFSAEAKFIFHLTANRSGGITMYINGTQEATSATYTPPTPPTSFFIGCNAAAAQQSGGVLYDCTIFPRAMSATEVSNDYTNLNQLLTDGDRIGHIPWLWTKDGDDVVDNCDDSGRDNFAACGGIPGSADALTEIDGTLSSDWTSAASNKLWLSRLDLDRYIAPTDFIFHDQSGTADVGNTCGDAYRNTAALSTGATAVGTSASLTIDMIKALSGRDVYYFGRLHDSGSNTSIAAAINYTSGVPFVADYGSISTGAAYRLHKTPPMVFPDWSEFFADDVGLSSFTLSLYAKRSSGTAAFRCDYFSVVPRPLVKFSPATSDVPTSAGFLHSGRRSIITGSDNFGTFLTTVGDVLELVPDRINLLISYIGDVDKANTHTLTLTYNYVKVTPRYALL